ncbi:hypothetical protein J7I11_004339 [Vibrio vulnificus]|nr:hypothetical protein [Vibrio vulnificus]
MVLALWFASENWLEMAVLSQVNHVFVVKHNKAFKSDSQRLAVSLRSSIAKRCSHLNAALCLITKNQLVASFLCSLGLMVLCLSASGLRLALFSGQLFFGAGNAENCLSLFSSKR